MEPHAWETSRNYFAHPPRRTRGNFKLFLLALLTMLSFTAHAEVRIWKRGSGQFNAVLYLQNMGSQAQQCTVSWENANGGFGNGRTIIIQPGQTEHIETRVIASNETFNCRTWADPFSARRAQEEEARRRQQEQLRRAQEEKLRNEAKLKEIWNAKRENERNQQQLRIEAEQTEQFRIQALKTEEMRQKQHEYNQRQQALEQQREAQRIAQEVATIKKQQRLQAQRETNLNNSRLFFEQNTQILNSTRRTSDTYADENKQLEELIRSMEGPQ